MEAKVPTSILKPARYLIRLFGNHFQYLGNRLGSDYWRFVFPKNTVVGFPAVYVFDSINGNAKVLDGEESLEALSVFLDAE